jgi:hypothetical protein
VLIYNVKPFLIIYAKHDYLVRKEEEMVSNDSRAFGTSPVGLQQHMIGVAWGIVVMAISLALVIILYMKEIS